MVGKDSPDTELPAASVMVKTGKVWSIRRLQKGRGEYRAESWGNMVGSKVRSCRAFRFQSQMDLDLNHLFKCVILSKSLGYKHSLQVTNESFSLFCMTNCPQIKGFYYNHYEELTWTHSGGSCAHLGSV